MIFFPDQAIIKLSQYLHALRAGPSSHPAVAHGIGRVVVTIFPKLLFIVRSEGSRAGCVHHFHSWHWILPSCPQAVLPLSLSQLTDFHTAHLSWQNGFLWKPVLLKMFYPALIMSSSLSALDESQRKLCRKWRNLKGEEEGSQLNTTESMKDFELKYMPMATQFFIIPLLFPYFYELGLFFFFHEELFYLLIPGTLTWPAQQ